MKSELEEALRARDIAKERNKLSIYNARLLLLLYQTAEKASFLLPFESCQLDISFFYHTCLWRFTTCSLAVQKCLERRPILRNSVIYGTIRPSNTTTLGRSFRLQKQATLRSIKSQRLLILTLRASISLVAHNFQLGSSLYNLAQSMNVMVGALHGARQVEQIWFFLIKHAPLDDS